MMAIVSVETVIGVDILTVTVVRVVPVRSEICLRIVAMTSRVVILDNS